MLTGFHAQGYPSGFPILIPTRTSRQRSAAALQYLLDGNYLDRKSKRLTAELLTYNADLRVMGYTQLSFDWQKDGTIRGGSLWNESAAEEGLCCKLCCSGLQQRMAAVCICRLSA